jgi:hypothetical protein
MPTASAYFGSGPTPTESCMITASTAAMPEQDADVLKILIGQIGECPSSNPIFSKTLGVLGHAELFEPVRNLLR